MSDQLKNLRFVAEVRKRPCLYDTSREDYANAYANEIAWREIGAIVNLTKLECKEKWRNIRTVFVRHYKLKKMLWENHRKVKKPYYLEQAMKFTLPYIKCKNRIGIENGDECNSQRLNEDMIVKPEESNETEDAGDNVQDDNENPLYLDDASMVDQEYASNKTYSEEITQKQNNVDENMEKQISDNSEFRDGMPPNILQVWSKKEKLDSQSCTVQDATKMFLLSLIPDIRQMNSSQLRTFKRKVLILIEDMLQE